MEYNEAVEQLIVPLDGPGNLVPPSGINRAAIQELVEFEYAISSGL
jgi:hypothetical protein